jgi:hypothetical protein
MYIKLAPSLILYDGFTLALKTTDKDMAAVVKNDSKTCKKLLAMKTCQCPKLLQVHVKDTTYKSARVLLVNVVIQLVFSLWNLGVYFYDTFLPKYHQPVSFYRKGFSLILYDGFTLALKTTDKAMAAVVKNDSKTCIRKFILETLGDENMSMSQSSSLVRI